MHVSAVARALVRAAHIGRNAPPRAPHTNEHWHAPGRRRLAGGAPACEL
jgi:hypothetical protein